MPTSKLINSNSAANCEKYLDEEKEDSDLPRVLYTSGQHCTATRARDQFRALRLEHGTNNAMRKAPGKYVEPGDPLADGAEPTHLKVGKNWRVAKGDETATHVRIPPEEEYVKQTEVVHYIVSFGLHEVNPDDPEQTQRAFEFAEALFAEKYAGVQAKLVAHGDAEGSKDAQERGEGGKFHVHVMANATVHTEFTVDGYTFKPGDKLSKSLTNVDRMRERHDEFLAERGRGFGLGPQILPPPRSKEASQVRTTDHDYFARQRGQISDQEFTQQAVETALGNLDPATVSGLDENERKLLLADEVKNVSGVELKLRTTKKGEVKLRSYVVPERKQPIGQSRLGDRYSDTGLDEQLELVAQSRWKPYERPGAGEPKPLDVRAAEAAELKAKADEMARAELDLQVVEVWDQAHELNAVYDRAAAGREAEERAEAERREAARVEKEQAAKAVRDQVVQTEVDEWDFEVEVTEPAEQVKEKTPEPQVKQSEVDEWDFEVAEPAAKKKTPVKTYEYEFEPSRSKSDDHGMNL